MSPPDFAVAAQSHLTTLCGVRPNRRTGSPGNRAATDYVATALRSCGCTVDTNPFACLDYVHGGALLAGADGAFDVHVSPYSLGCDASSAGLVAVSTVEELETVDCAGRILLLRGELCAEQLMPKHFVFYNPEHHQRIVALLESRDPVGIVTATEPRQEQVGALYPFPLIVDGDFDVPSVYCTEIVGDALAARQGEAFRLRIDSRRIPSTAANVIARVGPQGDRKIVVTAHVDAYEDTPGASDNASGTVVLLLLAEMLSDYRGATGVEIAVLNGEDHYSAGGQMDYLRRYGGVFPSILLAVNVDDVGFRQGGTSYSFYGCAAELEERVESGLAPSTGSSVVPPGTTVTT